jgi:3-hydroxy-9,10-secoandrosta-1,3,5(10)-triene-9,17-dione monooxygenase
MHAEAAPLKDAPMQLARVAERPPPIPLPEPGLTPEMLVQRALALRPTLREEQEANEERGGYSEALHGAFRQAGFYRITTPRLFGGYELPLPVFFRTMMEISRGDPGVGWCLTLAASHGWVLASHWPEQAQREIFGPDGHFVAPHRAFPMGTATWVADGWRIDGRWNYCSGIPHATHVIVTAMVNPDDAAPYTALAAVPRGQLTVLPDWGGDLTLGLRASGSHSIEITGAVIPEHHVVPSAALFARPDGMEDGTYGTRLHGNPMYLGRMMGPYQASLASVAVGAAGAAIDEYERIILGMKGYIDQANFRADNADAQRVLGLALAMRDAAEAIVVGATEKYMALCARWHADRTPITVADNFRLWTMLQQAGRLGCEVVEMLFHNTGGFVTRRGNRMQRYFRDAQMYRTHPSSQYDEFAGYVARAHLGRPTGFRGL